MWQAVLYTHRNDHARDEDPNPQVVLAYFDFMIAKNGMAAREVERKYGGSAWFMTHRVRRAR